MYRYDGWIEGAVTTVHSSGPKIIVTWLAEYKKRFDASHPELAVYFEFFRQQLFVFTNISENTEENVKSTWIGSAIMDRDHYYEKPSRYQNQLILQFDNQPSTEAAAHWLYNKRKEISVWVKIISSGYQERIIINGTIPQGFQFYDNQADKKARILLIGQGYNKQLSGLSGEETAQKIINVLASQVLATGINRNPILGDQTMDVISRISVVASDIEPARSHSSSSGREISSFSRGFTYQLLAHLRRSHIEIYEGVSVFDAIIGVDVVGRKWVGSWDLLSEKILWRSSQAAHKWVGVLTPSGNRPVA